MRKVLWEYIVTIGLAEEKFQVMALLPCRHSNLISSSIVMVGNSLLVYHKYIIWTMKEYGVEAEEKFKVMALFPCHSPISASILTVGNSLFVYHEFGIWMMKEYGVEESWTKVVYISPECLPQHFDNMLTPLCILENGEVLLRCRSLGLYNPEEKTFRNIICDCEAYFLHYVANVETLVSPITVGESERASKVENKPKFTGSEIYRCKNGSSVLGGSSGLE